MSSISEPSTFISKELYIYFKVRFLNSEYLVAFKMPIVSTSKYYDLGEFS